MNYLDFELEIGEDAGQGHALSVRSPVGETQVVAPFPYTDAQLETQQLKLENAILRSSGRRRQVLTPQEKEIQQFGQALFGFLLTGEAGNLYRECQREAAHAGSGVRLKLRIQPPLLTTLPWEFLYDPRRGDYVCLDPDTPLVRYLDLPQRIQPLAVEPPLRILGMVTSPSDLDTLDVAQEQQRLERALHPLQEKGLVDLTWLEGQTWRDLQRMMRDNYGPWHIFHFTGHGGFDAVRDEGVVVFADDGGRAERISATQLSRLLARQRSTMRLVLLNACEGARSSQEDVFSSTAATLVRGGIPAVLAMRYEITDAAAVEFARTFYEALADGLAVDTAVADARNAINLRDASSLEWGTPVLHMRAADGRIFALAETPRLIIRPEPVQPPQPTPAERLTKTSPEASRTAIANLRNVLADLYPGETSARRVVADAGLDDRRIAFSGQAANNWHAILSEATKTNQVEAVIAVVQGDYAQNRELAAAVAAYRGNPESDTAEHTSATETISIPASTTRRTKPHAAEEANDVASAPLPEPRRERQPEPTFPIEFDWVTIPAGPFLMGDGQEQHEVELPVYRIARTPVTNAQYKMFVEAKDYKPPSHWKNRTIPSGKENHPVVNVSWRDAMSFCQWAGVRLPSEAQWEKAARGTDGYMYPWGNEPPPTESLCNFGKKVRDTTPVDNYPDGASPYDVLDMAGNVWEWTSSLYQDYPYNPTDGREDLATEGRRVLRGGAFDFDEGNVRCAVRFRNYLGSWSYDVGFRVSSPGS